MHVKSDNEKGIETMKIIIFIVFINSLAVALNKPSELRLLPLYVPPATVVEEQVNQNITLQKPTELRILPISYDLTKPNVTIQSYSVKSYASTKKTDFSITFTGTPDFFTTDKAGREANTFQAYIMNTGSTPPSEQLWDIIIRGGEIRHYNNQIPIRNGFPHGATFDTWTSGGWDGLIGAVPYTLSSNTITFTIPWGLFKETDGRFYFEISSFHYGAIQDFFKGQAQLY